MALVSGELSALRTHARYNAAYRFIDRNVELGRGNKVAIIDDQGEVTYFELQKLVNQVGSALNHLGVRWEDRVLLVCYDSREFAAAFFGAIKVGAVPIPANTMLKADDY